MAARPVLLYDAGCRVCRFTARAVARLDRERQLSLRALQDDEARVLLDPLPADERLASWRLVRPDGSIVGRGAGAPMLLEEMRLTRPAGRLLARIPATVLDRAYDVLARNRGRLGRLVPDGPAPRR
jgi:predicted DCC family thiol-disulfide oxidoreductase YuxK